MYASLTERQTHKKTDSKENSLGISGIRVNIINVLYSIRIIKPDIIMHTYSHWPKITMIHNPLIYPTVNTRHQCIKGKRAAR